MTNKCITIAIALMVLTLGCNDAEVASRNLATAADNFEVYRRVVFYNGITDKYILSIEGYCSIKDVQGQLEVMVKTDGGFLKHHLGLSDNVTYFSEQLRDADVSDARYRVVFKPSVLIIDPELR